MPYYGVHYTEYYYSIHNMYVWHTSTFIVGAASSQQPTISGDALARDVGHRYIPGTTGTTSLYRLTVVYQDLHCQVYPLYFNRYYSNISLARIQIIHSFKLEVPAVPTVQAGSSTNFPTRTKQQLRITKTLVLVGDYWTIWYWWGVNIITFITSQNTTNLPT